MVLKPECRRVLSAAHFLEVLMGRTPRVSSALNGIKAIRYSRSRLGVVLLILLAPIWTTSCGGEKSSPTPTAPTTLSTPLPTVTGVSIGGKLTLTAVGETSQLTATATLSDNTTKDVTSIGRWQGGDIRVIGISPGGLLTVVGFGATWISFTYQSRGAAETVTATLPGTFVIRGRVREPGAGGLANVRVVDTITGRSATTDSDGEFSLAELLSLQAHLKAEKEGYEPAEVDATQTNVDLPLQRVVRLIAGETVRPAELAPNDLSYTVGSNRCSPCRLIRVVVPQAGTVHVRVTWTVMASKLSLFAEGQVVTGLTGELTADVPINAPREVLMYLGAAPPSAVAGHTAFTVETSLR
jgi:carboxypeptidase family protein